MPASLMSPPPSCPGLSSASTMYPAASARPPSSARASAAASWPATAAAASKAIRIGIGGQRQQIGEPLDGDIDRGQRHAERAEESRKPPHRAGRRTGRAAVPARQRWPVPAPAGCRGCFRIGRTRRRAGGVPGPCSAGRWSVPDHRWPLTSWKTVPLSPAPASRPTAAPTAAHIMFIPLHRRPAAGRRAVFGRELAGQCPVSGRPVSCRQMPDMSSVELDLSGHPADAAAGPTSPIVSPTGRRVPSQPWRRAWPLAGLRRSI